ncbi:DUF1499 domain-containing protein [Thalassotalea piscium]
MNKQIFVVSLTVILISSCSSTPPKLGVNNGELIPCPESPNCVSTQAIDEAHLIPVFKVVGTQEKAQKQLLQILKAWPRAQIVSVDKDYIRATFTSKIFQFVDDVEFYFPLSTTEETLIHCRSASRIGHSDFGVNRERVEKIANQLQALNNKN